MWKYGDTVHCVLYCAGADKAKIDGILLSLVPILRQRRSAKQLVKHPVRMCDNVCLVYSWHPDVCRCQP